MSHDDLRHLIWLYTSSLQDILNDYGSQFRRCHTAQRPIEGSLKATNIAPSQNVLCHLIHKELPSHFCNTIMHSTKSMGFEHIKGLSEPD